MNSYSRIFFDEVSEQNKTVKRETQAKNNGEQKCRRKITESCTLGAVQNYRVCTHADNLALGNTGPPEQQADTMTIRPREVVGPPMEVVARPTLTPQEQTLNYTENELPASFSRASC